MDSNTPDEPIIKSTWTRRKNFKHKGKWIDGVQRIAAEGSTLCLIAKVNYDLNNDEFVLKDCIGLVGGGLEECIDLLSERYTQFY